MSPISIYKMSEFYKFQISIATNTLRTQGLILVAY